MPTLVAKAPALAPLLEPHAAILHAGDLDRPLRPPASLRSCAAVSEPIRAVRLGANLFMRDWTYSVSVFLALSSLMTIWQAYTTRSSSSCGIGCPLVVMALVVTIMSVGLSSTESSEMRRGLSVEWGIFFIVSESMAPFPRMATAWA